MAITPRYKDYDGFYSEPLVSNKSALWGDLYALTMAQAFFTNGKHDLNTTFHAYIRANPFGGSYLVTGGQNIVFEWLRDHWRFDEQDLQVMREEKVQDPATGEMKPLFTPEFIDYVRNAKLALTIDAMPEGELAFPDEPIYRVHGPLWQCLMVEAAILNATNSQSLFATLASRLKEVADGAPILEFGLRRAQTLGGLEATRGAFIGGIDATSNMLARKFYNIPMKGTFAHALVMTYEDELEAFRDYARAMPANGVFLVDTYDTEQGVRKAVQACRELGVALKGIRLDSGDLTYLSKQARRILDNAGFRDAKITASNDLDEETIAALKQEGCKIDIWGVGTNLVTSKAQPALGAVYKLGAVFGGGLSQAELDAVRTLVREGRAPAGPDFVRDVIKLSEQAVKVTIPGELDVLRFIFNREGEQPRFDGDTIVRNIMRDPVRAGANPSSPWPDELARDIVSVRKDDDTLSKLFRESSTVYRPLQRFFDKGDFVRELETVHTARSRAASSLSMLEASHKRLKKPHRYVVGIEQGLYNDRRDMIAALRRRPA